MVNTVGATDGFAAANAEKLWPTQPARDDKKIPLHRPSSRQLIDFLCGRYSESLPLMLLKVVCCTLAAQSFVWRECRRLSRMPQAIDHAFEGLQAAATGVHPLMTRLQLRLFANAGRMKHPFPLLRHSFVTTSKRKISFSTVKARSKHKALYLSSAIISKRFLGVLESLSLLCHFRPISVLRQGKAKGTSVSIGQAIENLCFCFIRTYHELAFTASEEEVASCC